MKQSVEATIHFIQLTSILDQFYKAIVVIIPNSNHGRCLLEFIVGSIGQNLFFKDKIHDLSITCPCE